MADKISIGLNECPDQAKGLCDEFSIPLGEGVWTPEKVLGALEQTGAFQYQEDYSPLDVLNANFDRASFTLGAKWDDAGNVAFCDALGVVTLTDTNVGDVNTDAEVTLNGGIPVDINASGVVPSCGNFDTIEIKEGYGVLSGVICQKVATKGGGVLAIDQTEALAVGDVTAFVLPVNLFDTTGPYEYEITEYPAIDGAVATVTLDPATGAYTVTAVAAGNTCFGFKVTDTSTGFVSNTGKVTVDVAAALLPTTTTVTSKSTPDAIDAEQSF